MSSVSDIKLIRTDTTLDLSQKAEKRCPKMSAAARVVSVSDPRDMVVAILSRPMMLSWPRGGWWGARRKSWPRADPSDNICSVQEISRTVTNNDRKELRGVYVERSYGKGQEGHGNEARL